MASARNAVVGYTIDDLYFWSNVVTLLLLCGLVAIVLFQWRAMNKRELIAASLIAQLWNGRVSDRVEIERRTEQFNQLVEAHNAEAEAALSRKTGPSEQESDTNGSLTKSVRALGGRQRNLASGGGEDCRRRRRMRLQRACNKAISCYSGAWKRCRTVNRI